MTQISKSVCFFLHSQICELRQTFRRQETLKKLFPSRSPPRETNTDFSTVTCLKPKVFFVKNLKIIYLKSSSNLLRFACLLSILVWRCFEFPKRLFEDPNRLSPFRAPPEKARSAPAAPEPSRPVLNRFIPLPSGPGGGVTEPRPSSCLPRNGGLT